MTGDRSSASGATTIAEVTGRREHDCVDLPVESTTRVCAGWLPGSVVAGVAVRMASLVAFVGALDQEAAGPYEND